jgi:hypothetical protein
LVLSGAAAAMAGAAAIALAASGGGGSPPPAEPLPQAIQDALSAPRPAGITADLKITDNLFPSGSLTGDVVSALLAGASGQVWVSDDGHGRVELQSDAGSVQIAWSPTDLSAYVPAANAVYRLPLDEQTQTQTPPSVDQIAGFLSKLAEYADVSVSPTVVGGEGAYSVSVLSKDQGGLIGSAELAWDALNGTPLRIAVYAKGSSSPAFAVEADNVSFGPVSSSDVELNAPADAKVVDLSRPSGQASSGDQAVSGLAAVQAAAPFPVVAPDTLNGLAATDVRLAGSTVVVTYGNGLGAVVVVERAADSSDNSSGGGLVDSLPTVTVGGETAHELATTLGTVLAWEQSGVSFVLAGSVSAADAEAAAAALG